MRSIVVSYPLLYAALVAELLVLLSCTPLEPPEEEVPGGSALPTYLGQPPPGATPEVFAPGIVSTRLSETGLTVSPDGRDVVFSVRVDRIRVILIVPWEAEGWGEPRVAPFSGHHDDWEPVFSPDGRRVYFVSSRPTAAAPEGTDPNLWYAERTDSEWSVALEVGSPVNSAGMGEGYPSVTRDGALYFFRYSNQAPNLTELFRADCAGDTCGEPELLPPGVNSRYHDWDPFVAPDESYLIFSSPGRPDGQGDADLYITFRTDGGGWSEAVNMGPRVNSPGSELCPFVSHDGRYLFFERYDIRGVRPTGPQPSFQRPPQGTAITYPRIVEMAEQMDVSPGESFWMDAGIIEELRREVMGRR